MRFFCVTSIALLFVGLSSSSAATKTETVKYKAGSVEAQGFLAEDPAISVKRPGIVIVPEWWGLDDYARSRAEQLVQLGYVAFVADVYGSGKTTEDPKQAGEWAGALRNGDRKELRARVVAAVEQLRNRPNVDGTRIAAIGYCFGGTTVLELARSGADIKGVVSFHGDLTIATPAQAGQVKAKILVCHGGDDPFSKPEQVTAFQDEMRQAKADWEFSVYGGAVHGFTNPTADKHGIPGIAYNKEADKRSWQAMQDFFKEIF